MLLYWLFGELLLQTLSQRHPTQPYRFQTALSHSTLLECCALGQFYEFHLVVIRYPIRTLIYILAIVLAYGCKSSAAPQWCSKYTEIPRIIAIQLYKNHQHESSMYMCRSFSVPFVLKNIIVRHNWCAASPSEINPLIVVNPIY